MPSLRASRGAPSEAWLRLLVVRWVLDMHHAGTQVPGAAFRRLLGQRPKGGGYVAAFWVAHTRSVPARPSLSHVLGWAAGLSMRFCEGELPRGGPSLDLMYCLCCADMHVLMLGAQSRGLNGCLAWGEFAPWVV